MIKKASTSKKSRKTLVEGVVAAAKSAKKSAKAVLMTRRIRPKRAEPKPRPANAPAVVAEPPSMGEPTVEADLPPTGEPAVVAEPRPVNGPAVAALQAERQRLLDELKHQEVVEQEHPTTGNHMADDASEVSEQAKTLALRRHLEGMLKEIDRAIARAERGTYGLCEHCGKPIAAERLQVMPAACLCIDCAKQQARTNTAKAAA